MKLLLKGLCDEYQKRFTQNMRDRSTLEDLKSTDCKTAPYIMEIRKLQSKIENESMILQGLDATILQMATEDESTIVS